MTVIGMIVLILGALVICIGWIGGRQMKTVGIGALLALSGGLIGIGANPARDMPNGSPTMVVFGFTGIALSLVLGFVGRNKTAVARQEVKQKAAEAIGATPLDRFFVECVLAGYDDLNTQRAQEMAVQYGGKVYDSYFDLLNDPSIDAVSICVENRSHAEITTYALYAGKHVLCEKPMAVTLAECESMVAAAERNGKHLMIGHNMRFDPVHRKAKELLDGGIIGDIITFRATMGNAGPENWSMEAGSTWFFDKQKAAMGALSDLGIHKVDLLQYLTGQKVIETTAKVMTLNKHTATGAPITVDDNALCILRMSGGAVGTLAASWTVYGHECQSTCLYGTKGIMLIYNNNNPAAPIEVRNLDGTSTTYNIPPETNSGVIDEFVDALEHDREPEVSGKEALSTMRAMFGSIKSSEIGRTVSVNTSFVNHL